MLRAFSHKKKTTLERERETKIIAAQRRAEKGKDKFTVRGKYAIKKQEGLKLKLKRCRNAACPQNPS